MVPVLFLLAFIEGIGGPELLLIFFIVLILFGGQRLPDFARGLGRSIKEFKKAASGVEEEIKRAIDDPAPSRRPAPRPVTPVTPAPTAALTPPPSIKPPEVE